jgi:hypothetical protein
VFSNGNDSQGQGHGQGATVTSDEYLSEQRRLAFQRVSQKRQEEDRLIAERLRREEEERAEYRKLMEEKAEKLKQLTAKRVADYKVCLVFSHLPTHQSPHTSPHHTHHLTCGVARQ